MSGERALRNVLAGALDRFDGAGEVPRSDRDGDAGEGEPERESEAERAGCADHCDGIGGRLWQGGRV
jgi:hypothetical protein